MRYLIFIVHKIPNHSPPKFMSPQPPTTQPLWKTLNRAAALRVYILRNYANIARWKWTPDQGNKIPKMRIIEGGEKKSCSGCGFISQQTMRRFVKIMARGPGAAEVSKVVVVTALRCG